MYSKYSSMLPMQRKMMRCTHGCTSTMCGTNCASCCNYCHCRINAVQHNSLLVIVAPEKIKFGVYIIAFVQRTSASSRAECEI